MSRPLYAIRADVLYLGDLLEEAEGDLSQADPAVERWLAALEQEQAEKLDAYVNLIRQLRMEAAAAKAEKEQWAMKEKMRSLRADYLEGRLKDHLAATGQPKVVTASGRTVAVVRNGGKPPLVVADDFYPAHDEAIPSDCVRIKREYDREAIRRRLEAGDYLPPNFAHLGEPGTHLRVS